MIKSVDSVNLNGIQRNVSFKAQGDEKQPVQEDKKTNYKSLAIGAASVSAVVIGGLLINHKLKLNKLNKAINELVGDLGKIVKQESDVFDNSILQKYIDEALKLPKKDQIARLEELSIVKPGKDRALLGVLKNEQRRSKLPQSILDAVAEKDQFEATKAYIEYCDTLFHKSKTAGATIQESIENVFGKNSIIKPHTYNPADEAEYICGYIDKGGYKDLAINSKNMIADGANHKALFASVNSRYISHVGTRATIQQDVYEGQTYVTMLIPNGRSGDKLVLASKDGKTLTPAQKDLLSLDAKLSEDDMKLFEQLFSNYGPNGQIVSANDVIKNGETQLGMANYDAILSTIQTLAQKVNKAG